MQDPQFHRLCVFASNIVLVPLLPRLLGRRVIFFAEFGKGLCEGVFQLKQQRFLKILKNSLSNWDFCLFQIHSYQKGTDTDPKQLPLKNFDYIL